MDPYKVDSKHWTSAVQALQVERYGSRISCQIRAVNYMEFLDINLSNGILPVITKPTRITHDKATLIDNIYIDLKILIRA